MNCLILTLDLKFHIRQLDVTGVIELASDYTSRFWEQYKMAQKQKFRAVIENAGGGGAFVSVPFDVEKVFGKKRVKIKATICWFPGINLKPALRVLIGLNKARVNIMD